MVKHPDYTHNPAPVGVLSVIACLQQPDDTNPWLLAHWRYTAFQSEG